MRKRWITKLLAYSAVVYLAVITPFTPIIGFTAEVLAADFTTEFSVDEFSPPTKLDVNETKELAVKLTNNSITEWSYEQFKLSYKWEKSGSATAGSQKSDLIGTVLAAGNTADEQKIVIQAPDTPGTYQLEIYLYNFLTDNYYRSTTPQSFTVEINLFPDTKKPTGELRLNNGDSQTTDNQISWRLTGTDPAATNQEISGLDKYRVVVGSDFTEIDWEDWQPGDQTGQITLGTDKQSYTVSAQIKDKAGNIEEVASEIELVNPDTTAPTLSIDINNGDTTTTNRKIQVKLTATDPTVNHELKSGLKSYRIALASDDIATADWKNWDSNIEFIVPLVAATHQIHAQVRDEAGNISNTANDEITLETAVPLITKLQVDPGKQVDVDGSQQVQDRDLEVVLEAESNFPITEYIVSDDNDFSNDSWASVTESGLSISTKFNYQLPAASGDYTLYVKVRNESKESAIAQVSAKYTHFQIDPLLTTKVDKLLFGGKADLTVTLGNSGPNNAYNAGVEITLPKGFSFDSSLRCDSQKCYVPGETLPTELTKTNDGFIEPTLIKTNSNGEQVLHYKSIADLLAGESVTIELRVKVGGLAAGYKLGQEITIPVTGKLYKRSNFFVANEITSEIKGTLQPFVIDFNQSPNDESLVGETTNNELIITTNPDIPTSFPRVVDEVVDPTPTDPNNGDEITVPQQKNPLEVIFKLDNGVEVIADSIKINNYLGDPAKVIVNILAAGGLNNILQIIFADIVTTDQYQNPIQILFDTIIPKFNQGENRYTDHNEEVTTEVTTRGEYSNPLSTPVTYNQTAGNKLRAKYFTVDKWAVPGGADIGDTVTYYVRIKTSPEYNLTGIELTDILPDGVSYLGNITQSANLDLILHSNTTDTTTGLENLIWRVTAAQGVVAGSTYEFTYDAKVDHEYDTKNLADGDKRLFSNDYLTSLITLRGLWGDTEPSILNPNDPRAGMDEDQGGATLNMPKVSFTSGIRANSADSFVKDIQAKIGDKLEIQAIVNFAGKTPTNNFNYRLYLPVGTKLVDTIKVGTTGTFSGTTSQILIEGGYLYNFGKVEPGASITFKYVVEVQDDINLANAVKTRNLFRADYTNIDELKLTYRDEVTLTIIEPIISLTKQTTSGYLAKGEEVTIETVVTNSGTDTAYGINLVDYLPSNTTLVDVVTITHSNNTAIVPTLNSETDKFSSSAFNLAAGESIKFIYKVKVDADVVFDQPITSKTNISDYDNRAETDPLLKRTYPEFEIISNWKASEPLLVTSLTKESNSNNPIEIGRNESFNLVATVTTVGGAPVYNTEIKVDLSQLGSLTNDLSTIPATVFIGNTSTPLSLQLVSPGIYQLNDTDILPGKPVTIKFALQSDKFVALDQSWDISVVANGKAATADDVRKDPCAGIILGIGCTTPDTDSDDQTITQIITKKLESDAPTGSITFKQNNQSITVVREPNVDITYQAVDASGVVGVRFSNNGTDWTTLDAVNKLTTEIVDALELSGEWNEWDGKSTDIAGELLTTEGKNFRYMEVVDVYGNVATISNSVILDTTAPRVALLNISPVAGDLSNPLRTSLTDNYLNFVVIDDTTAIDVAGLGSYKYSIDGEDWSDWEELVDGTNTKLVNFPTIDEGKYYYAYLQIKDRVGNTYQRQAAVTDPRTGEDLAEDQIMDAIRFQLDRPVVSIQLNDSDEYTKNRNASVELTVEESTAGVTMMRIAGSQAAITSETWFPYTTKFFTRNLDQSDSDGKKQMCVQLKDAANALSDISCDNILLDTTAPAGLIIINSGETETADRNIKVNIAASDSNPADGSTGSWGVEMRFSTTGENCYLLNDANEFSACESKWTQWEVYQSVKDWQLSEQVGQQVVYAQLRDRLDNASQVYTRSIVFNPFNGTGGIVINDNDLFTNSKNVNLKLDVDLSETDCSGCTKPVLMRFYQTNGDEVPPTPPTVSSPTQDQKGWTYWQQYYTPVQWNLDANNTSGKPNYGKKNIYVQYKLPNTTEIGLFSDSIIYAPYYFVTYNKSDSISNLSDSNNYGLNRVPSQLLAQEQINIKFNAQNLGSFTWPTGGDNPVRFTYKWVRTGGELPAGWTADMVPTEIRGNASNLAENIGWNQVTGEVTLRVDTPIIPGDYKLVIDAVHEGQAWFGDWGSETPTYQIRINENPSIPTPEFSGNVLGENTSIGGQIPIPYEWSGSGWGQDCADRGSWPDGTVCYFSGTWQVSRDTNWHAVCSGISGGYYQYEMYFQGQGTYFFCPGNEAYWDQFINTQMAAKVEWDWSIDYGTHFDILALQPARKYWQSELRTGDNDTRIFSEIAVNRSSGGTYYDINLQPWFFNSGNGIWRRGEVYLAAVDANGNEQSSPFQAPNWASASRINVEVNGSGWGQWTKAPFTMTIRIPESMSWGKKTQCFKVVRDGTAFERSDMWCLKLDVQMTYKEKRTYFCPLPHPVYKSANTSSQLIGNIQQNSEFIILENQGGWSRIFFPTGEGEEGWVENNLECFSEAEIIENVIPIPTFNTIPPPTGDNGNVINLNGIEVKNGPADSFDTIATIPYGAHVQVIGEAHINDNQYGGWLKVRLDDGTEGWVPKGSIWHTNDPQDIVVNLKPDYYRGHICGSDIPVYPLPGVKNKQVATLKDGSNVSILKFWNGWYQVYYDQQGNTGWIESMGGICQGYHYPRADLFCAGELGYPYSSEKTVTSEFGPRGDGHHDGIDLAGAYGEDILAAEDGRVLYAGTDQHGGKYVVIDHPRLNLKTVYVHLSQFVVTGGDVFKGMVIGKTGNSGYVLCYVNGAWRSPAEVPNVPTCGTHLHFSVIDKSTGQKVNPRSFWQGGTCPVVDEKNKDAIEKKSQAEELIKRQEDLWNKEFTHMEGNRGELHLWSNTCSVWVKDYQDIWAGDIDIRNEWAGQNNSGGGLIYNHRNDKLYLLGNAIWAKYIQDGGPCGKLGLPVDTNGTNTEQPAGISDDSKNRGISSASYQSFENGSIYWHYNWRTNSSKAITVSGNISKVFEAFGGTWSKYGFPIADQVGQCQQFEGGKICENEWDPAEIAILRKEQSYSRSTRDGVIHEWCGTKVLDFHDVEGAGDGIIMYNPNRGQAFLIIGKMWDTFLDNGRCEEFGFPTGDAGGTANVAGYYQHFEKANIYWSLWNDKSQPGIVKGAIRDFYESKGGTNYWLEFPEGKEWGAESYCGTKGTMQHFTKGRVYSSKFGSFATRYDAFFDMMNDHGLGGYEGTGWPTSEIFDSGWGSRDWQVERGLLNDDILSNTFDKSYSCGFDAKQRRDSGYSDKDALAKIHAAEVEYFGNFERKDDGDGTVHNWCGTTVVDYKSITLKNGQKSGETIMMLNRNHNKAYFITGEIWMKFRDRSKTCEWYGWPTGNTYLNGAATSPQGTTGDYQSFENGNFYHSNFGTHFVRGDARAKHDSWQGTGGQLGFPKNDAVWSTAKCTAAGGWHQEFQGGKIYDPESGTTTAFYYSGMLDRYWQNGEVGGMGWPLGDKYKNEYSQADTIDLEKGVIYDKNGIQSEVWGCDLYFGQREFDPRGEASDIIHAAEQRLFGSFNRQDYSKGKQIFKNSNGVIHQFCRADGTSINDSWAVNYDTVRLHGGTQYQKSMLVINGKNAYLVSGAFLDKYNQIDGCSELGLPNSTEATSDVNGTSVAVQGFQFGAIYKWWIGTVVLNGRIAVKYSAEGGQTSFLGLPQKDKVRSASVCGIDGYHQEFQGGKIYSSGNVDDYSLKYGSMQDKYWESGEVGGKLGWPREDLYEDSKDTLDFEKGLIAKNGNGFNVNYSTMCLSADKELVGEGTAPVYESIADYVCDPTDGGQYEVGDEYYGVACEEIDLDAPSIDLGLAFQNSISRFINLTQGGDILTNAWRGVEMGANFYFGLLKGLIWDNTVGLVTSVVDMAKMMWDIKDQIPELVQSMIDAVKKDGFVEVIKNIGGEMIKGMILDFLNATPTEQAKKLGEMIGGLLPLIASIIAIPFTGGLSGAAAALKSAVTGGVQALRTAITGIINLLKNIGTAIVTGIKKLVTAAINIGGKVINFLKNVATGKVSVSSIFSSISSYVDETASGLSAVDKAIETEKLVAQAASKIPSTKSQLFALGKAFEKKISALIGSRNSQFFQKLSDEVGDVSGFTKHLQQVQIYLKGEGYVILDDALVKKVADGIYEIIPLESKLTSGAPFTTRQNQLITELKTYSEFTVRSAKFGSGLPQGSTVIINKGKYIKVVGQGADYSLKIINP